MPTESPTSVFEGPPGKDGNREAERDVTAKMELRVVRGSWGRPASMAPLRKSEGEGMTIWGCQAWKPEVEEPCCVVDRVIAARIRPRRKTIRA